jgi:probable phosphoglycerate mutase
LQRAIETCRLAGFGDWAKTDPDLVEWDYGDYEGRTTADIRAERPEWSLWKNGVPNGETAGQVGRRADRVIAEARAAGGDVIFFGHGHMLRVVGARWVALPPRDGGLLGLGTGALCVLGYEHDLPIIDHWNEASA